MDAMDGDVSCERRLRPERRGTVDSWKKLHKGKTNEKEMTNAREGFGRAEAHLGSAADFFRPMKEGMDV